MSYTYGESRREAGIGFIISLVWLIPEAIINGFTVMVLWNWFIPLIWTGAPYLNIGLAIGLQLVISFIIARKPVDDGKGVLESVIESIITLLLYSAFFLGYGYIVHAIIT